MSETNHETGEITAVATVETTEIATRDPRTGMMPLEAMGDLMDKLDTFIKEKLVEGTDYGNIPGTGKGKKPLLQPGMQKLNTLFGHYADPTIETEDLDHHIKWEYEKDIWEGPKGQKTKKTIKVETIGFFFYRVRCDLKNHMGETVSSYHGTCSSRERGRETSPANTICKIAEKRAQMSATVNVTFCSERFTVDIDGYHKSEYGGSGGSGGSTPAKEGTLGFGKHADTLISEVEGGYLRWCIENMDGGSRVDMCQAELDRREKAKSEPDKEVQTPQSGATDKVTPESKVEPVFDRATTITRITDGLMYLFPDDAKERAAMIKEHTGDVLTIKAEQKELEKLWAAVKIAARDKKKAEQQKPNKEIDIHDNNPENNWPEGWDEHK